MRLDMAVGDFREADALQGRFLYSRRLLGGKRFPKRHRAILYYSNFAVAIEQSSGIFLKRFFIHYCRFFFLQVVFVVANISDLDNIHMFGERFLSATHHQTT